MPSSSSPPQNLAGLFAVALRVSHAALGTNNAVPLQFLQSETTDSTASVTHAADLFGREQ